MSEGSIESESGDDSALLDNSEEEEVEEEDHDPNPAPTKRTHYVPYPTRGAQEMRQWHYCPCCEPGGFRDAIPESWKTRSGNFYQ